MEIENIKIIKGDRIELSQRIEVGRIFARGFYQWLKFFSKDAEKLARGFENSFLFDKFYFAVSDDKLCGMAACTNGKNGSIKLVRKDLIKALGFLKGNLAYCFLRKELESKPYPFEIEENCGSIEFVAVLEECRGKGVGTALLKRIIAEAAFEEYVLEVADTNNSAVPLYEKNGFFEFKRIPQKNAEKTGINNFIYMKYKK